MTEMIVPSTGDRISFSLGNYTLPQNPVGTYSINNESGTIDVSCAGTTNPETAYRFQTQFQTSTHYDQIYKYMSILYSATNPENASNVLIRLVNTAANGGNIVLENNVSNTNGRYVFTTPIELTSEFTARFDQPAWVQLRFVTMQTGGLYKVKAFYFFKTADEASAFVNRTIDYQKLSFDSEGNADIDSSFGHYTYNQNDGTIDISYNEPAPSVPAASIPEVTYRFQSRFHSSTSYDPKYKFLRILYAATNPTGVDSVVLKLANSGDPYGTLLVTSDVVNTNNLFVLSPTCELTSEFTTRFDQPAWVQLRFVTAVSGGSYRVKGIYFFDNLDDANAFETYMDDEQEKTIAINGVDISNYRIVIPTAGFGSENDYAINLRNEIYRICGAELTIVNDSTTPSTYEILIGNTNRTESQSYYSVGNRFHPSYPKYSVAEYRIDRLGNTVVIASAMSLGIEKAIDLLVYRFDNTKTPVNLTESCIGSSYLIFSSTKWQTVNNVNDPIIFTDDFESGAGYWSTESGINSWTIAQENNNTVFSSANNNLTFSYLHVFEKNASIETKLKYTSQNNGRIDLVLRYTAEDAYVKAGYDFEEGKWYIESREGKDFLCYRLASTTATLVDGQWYTVKAVVNDTTAELFVNSIKILETNNLTQKSPGRIGLMSNGVAAQSDDVSVVLLSGQGSIIPGVVHTKLPDELYREGGSVVELTNGSLVYNTYRDDACFTSNDSGKTWIRRATPWVDLDICPQILRLNNGTLLWVTLGYANNVQVHEVRSSNDDGATWTTVGIIRERQYNSINPSVRGSNMNDKITQMSDGRIFYSICYDAQNANPQPVPGKSVFCEFFYSDDNGATWTQSLTGASFDIYGNENEAYFGECKILETSTPGTLRMYNSWNSYGCIAYSESTDNGVTWGPIQLMSNYVCSCSSMQFARDPYATNDTTYYMVWVKDDNATIVTGHITLPRAHLSLAYTTDGINWVPLGDIWRWENRYKNIAQLVDPFILVTDDYLIIGSGISEEVDSTQPHNAQRQHIFTIPKSSLLPVL